jgi:hypothetical protein
MIGARDNRERPGATADPAIGKSCQEKQPITLMRTAKRWKPVLPHMPHTAPKKGSAGYGNPAQCHGDADRNCAAARRQVGKGIAMTSLQPGPGRSCESLKTTVTTAHRVVYAVTKCRGRTAMIRRPKHYFAAELDILCKAQKDGRDRIEVFAFERLRGDKGVPQWSLPGSSAGAEGLAARWHDRPAEVALAAAAGRGRREAS